MKQRKISYYLVGALMLSLFLFGCTQYSTKVPNVVFHNTTAYFNAYYLADERLQKVEGTLKSNHKEDFNQILRVFYPIDTSKAKGYKKDLEYIENNGSAIIHKHQNSNWIDDAYIIIGKTKLYEGKFRLAVNFFKYVNTQSENYQARMEAMAWLMRSYIESGEPFNAEAVSDFVEKQSENEKLNDKNIMLISLARSHFYYLEEDYPKMLQHLEVAIPHIKVRDKRSRAHFIAGQLHQLLGNNDEAFEHYKNVIKRNPPYEFDFHARLNMAQVNDAKRGADVKKIRKYFDKLLKDEKNEEYKDRIYYEIAKYDLKQGKVPDAIINLNNSLKAGGDNQQKAYSYLELGNINYDAAEFEVSKLYYDSVVSVLPKDFRKYEEISDRQKILTRFVEQLDIISSTDSLVKVWDPKIDSAQREKMIDEAIEGLVRADSIKQFKVWMKAKNDKKEALSIYENPQSKFVFYNPRLLQKSREDFAGIYDDNIPPDVDNWNRSESDEVKEFIEQEASNQNTSKTDEDKPTIKKLEVDRSRYYKPALKSKEDFLKAQFKVNEARYKLGKIYYLSLKENENAIKEFTQLLKEDPTNEHNIEVMYFMYLMCKKSNTCNSEKYKDTLLNHFPRSIYAKIILNPNAVKESKQENIAAHKAYDYAYSYYRKRDYFQALKQFQKVEKEYPYSDIKDKISLMKIYCYGHTHGANKYRKLLEEYIDTYIDSPLRPRAKKNLADLDKNSKRIASQAIADTVKVVYLDDDFKEEHFYLIHCNNAENEYDKILAKFYKINKASDQYKNLEVTKIDVNSNEYFVKISKFILQDSARSYMHMVTKELNTVNELSGLSQKSFIISKSNLSLLLNSKDLDGYLEFYRAKYKP